MEELNLKPRVVRDQDEGHSIFSLNLNAVPNLLKACGSVWDSAVAGGMRGRGSGSVCSAVDA